MRTLVGLVVFALQIVALEAAPFLVIEDFKGTVAVGGGDVMLPVPKGSLVEIANFDVGRPVQSVEFNTFKFEIPTAILQEKIPIANATPPPKPSNENASATPALVVKDFTKDPIAWKVEPLSFLVNGAADIGVWAPPPVSTGYNGVLVLLPGRSENPFLWVKDPAWQSFAKEQNLILFGVAFTQKAAVSPTQNSSIPVSPSSPQTVRFINENLAEGVKRLEDSSGMKLSFQRNFIFYGYEMGANLFEELRGTSEFPDEKIVAVATAPYKGFSNLRKMGVSFPLLICTSKPAIVQDQDLMKAYYSNLKKGAPWTLALAPTTYGATTPALSRAFFAYNLKVRLVGESSLLKPALGKTVDDKDNPVSTSPLNFLPEDPVFLEKLQKFRSGAPYSPSY